MTPLTIEVYNPSMNVTLQPSGPPFMYNNYSPPVVRYAPSMEQDINVDVVGRQQTNPEDMEVFMRGQKRRVIPAIGYKEGLEEGVGWGKRANTPRAITYSASGTKKVAPKSMK